MLECEAAGRPTPSMYWEYDGDSVDLVITHNVLLIVTVFGQSGYFLT